MASGILLNNEEFYELRQSRYSQENATIVTFCLLEIRQCMIEGDMFLFEKSKYSVSLSLYVYKIHQSYPFQCYKGTGLQ